MAKCGLEQHRRTDDLDPPGGRGVDRTIDMAFGSEMIHGARAVLLEDCSDGRTMADVGATKT